MLKITKLNVLMNVSLIIAFAITSCKKNPPIQPLAFAEFNLKDTLKVEAVSANSPFSDIYQNYNGKSFKIIKSNKVKAASFVNNGKILLSFIDSTNLNTPTKLEISISESKENLTNVYTLKNSLKVECNNIQKFMDGSSAFTGNSVVTDGALEIKYNASNKTISGELKHLVFPLEYFVPENISITQRSSSGIILKQLSTREFNITFKNVPLNSSL